LQSSSVRQSIKTILYESSLEGQKAGEGKKRNFVETVELSIGLKGEYFICPRSSQPATFCFRCSVLTMFVHLARLRPAA
jgi:hypothetical protein